MKIIHITVFILLLLITAPAMASNRKSLTERVSEAVATQTQTSTPTVTPTSTMEKYSDEYYSNGQISVEYKRNSSGLVSRINYYNRYSYVTSYIISKKWDLQGNILSDTEYYVNRTGKYREYHNEYSYDDRGNKLTSSYTYADGSKGYSSVMEYDERNRLIRRTEKDPDGKITNIDKDFEYDDENNLIAFVSYDEEGQFKSRYHARFEKGVRVEYWETDQNGNIIDKGTCDPVFGEIIVREYISGEKKYVSYTNYREDYYEEDRRLITDGRRYVTRYNFKGERLRSDGYTKSQESTDWNYDYSTEYSTNDSGSIIENRKYSDGSTYYSEQDQNGNLLLSRMTRSDGSFFFAYSRVYDNAGNLIRENSLNEDGTTEYYTLYEQGRKTRKNTLTERGTIQSYETYEYNSDGKQSRINTYYSDGTLKKYELYGYHENGKTAYNTEYDRNGMKKYEFIYDENGEMTYYASYNEGKLSSEFHYRTLSDGTKQRKWNYYYDGKLFTEGEWENE